VAKLNPTTALFLTLIRGDRGSPKTDVFRGTSFVGQELSINTLPKVEGKMHHQAIERALEISRKRRGYLDAMRKAIHAGDKDSVFELARKLTGLSDEESHRTDSRFN
jgi:hypothetical protein